MKLLFIAALAFCAGSAPSIQGAPSATFYVATNGNDAWPGTLPKPGPRKADGPFATLAKARDAARALKSGDPTIQARIVVGGGEYFLSAPLDLTARTRD